MSNPLDLLKLPNAHMITEKLNITWLGIVIPVLTLILSIIVVWIAYKHYSKEEQ